jgi:glycosyltransferase involved in cell wall biosynthesis
LVHYIGVDTDFFRVDPTFSRRPIVLFVARLEEVKGCEYAIRAMELVQRTNPEWEFVVIGDGTQRSDLEQAAREKLRSVRFLGMQPPRVVREWMNRASIFCVPSVVARDGATEAFGLVFAEAQAMGLPVVSFTVGGIPEAVIHGETGFLAPERDVDGLAHFLEKLCANEGLRARMGEAARAHICAHFNLRDQTRKLEELYMQVFRARSDFVC